MNNKSIMKAFLFPTLLHITAVAVLVGILKEKGYGLGYHSFWGWFLLSLEVCRLPFGAHFIKLNTMGKSLCV
ncbi:hypothetical protein HMPREF1145_1679 [Oribacterium parvum ACB8]|uniref:hypothetical protein n=1 Tax=Oribacterium parvum TaxID=1501329 RepID=UPI00026F0618|nr:hypothetical protein [Oribacterium parvum]EJF14097.1 hypothetical protein HMPREF1145_1679 [Oribacterium parvum ACB8]